ncbi:MAG: regulatory protein RecX [Eubacterium sp.]
MEEKSGGYPFTDEEGKRAAKKAMELIAYKDRTRKELEERLYRAGFSEKASMQAMEYVMSFGYINDRRYVENYLMFQTGKRSKKDICFKLQQKGISQELIEEIMFEQGGIEEAEAIETLVKKRLKGREFSDLERKERDKIFAYLGRKGYEISQIKKVFSKLDI